MTSTPIAIVTFLLAAAAAGPAMAGPIGPRHPADTLERSASPLLEVRQRYYRQAAPATETDASAVIKPGAWQFNAELQSAVPAPPVGQGQQSEAGFQAPYTICIDAQRPVPSALGPRCKLDKVTRQSGDINWSMTCSNPEGAVHSDGVAQYHGDTMEASVVSHLPNAAGKVTDISQRITGHYLGTCNQTAANSGGQPGQAEAAPWVEPPPAGAGAPPATSGTAAPPPNANTGRAEATAPPSTNAGRAEATAPPATYHPQYAYHRRHYSRRHYRYYGHYGGAPFPFSLIFGR